MGIRIIGTGSSLPSQEVGNDELLHFLGPPKKPNGQPITHEWMKKHFGIVTRRFDFDFARGQKRSPAEGGIYENDIAVSSVNIALKDAGVSADQIDALVHVSCTPDRDPRCGQNLIEAKQRLGLRPDSDIDYQNLGCAGVAKGLRVAQGFIATGARVVVVVASNMTSAQLVRDRYIDQSQPGAEWAWLSPMVFSDGAAAMILTNDAPEGEGLLGVAYETHPTELVRFLGGGGLNVTCVKNVHEHRYVMDAVAVSQAFEHYMRRNLELLAEHPGTRGMTAHDFNLVLIHQANGPAVKTFAEAVGLPPDRVPINIDRLGNASSAATLLLLDEARRTGHVKKGDKILFLWIGAGVGTMNGFAAFKL